MDIRATRVKTHVSISVTPAGVGTPRPIKIPELASLRSGLYSIVPPGTGLLNTAGFEDLMKVGCVGDDGFGNDQKVGSEQESE